MSDVRVLALVVLLAACSDDAESGPTGALEAALVRARPAATSDEATARIAGSLAAAAPHHMEITAELRIEPAGGVQRLQIARTIDRGPKGAFRIADRRTWSLPSVFPGNEPKVVDDRVTSVFDGAALAIRRADGPWVERDTLDGHAGRLLDAAYDLDGLVLGAFEDYLDWVERPADETHPAVVAGLPVRWFGARLDPSVQPKVLDPEALAALRDHVDRWPAWVAATHRPMRVDGEVAKDSRGELVLGQLEVVGIATVEGQDAPFVLRVAVTVAPAPSDATFALPAERLPVNRPRPWKMIESVLGDDLTPAYREP